MTTKAETPRFPDATTPAAQTDDDRPRFWGALGNVVHLLGQIARSVARREHNFREVCASGNNGRIGSQLVAGVLRTVHNPTTGALLVTLSDGTNGAVVVFSATLTAGESRPLFLAFKDGLYCVAGNGAVVGGTFDA